MLAKTVLWTAVCLCLCNAERIRILNLDDAVQNDSAARGALKSKIRSLTLKSSIERELFNSDNHHSEQKASKKPTTSEKLAAPDTFAGTSTTDKYFAPITESTASVPKTTTAQGSAQIDPNKCYKLVECVCNNGTGPPSPTPQSPCSRGPPIPRIPLVPGSYPDSTYSQGPSSAGCCGVDITLPCYPCPCLSQCSIVPAASCPCPVDQTSEYQCPHIQPQVVPYAELSVYVDQGWRLADTLNPAPNCAYIPGIPSHPPAAPYQQWPGSSYANQPYQAASQQHSNQFVALGQGEQQQHIQPSNMFLNRQQRQRPNLFSQSGGYQRGGYYQPGPVPSYPVGPQPYPPPQNGSGYALPPSQPIPHYPPAPQYALPSTSTDRSTTTQSSSSAVYIVSSSAVVVSLMGLLGSAFLIL